MNATIGRIVHFWDTEKDKAEGGKPKAAFVTDVSDENPAVVCLQVFAHGGGMSALNNVAQSTGSTVGYVWDWPSRDPYTPPTEPEVATEHAPDPLAAVVPPDQLPQ